MNKFMQYDRPLFVKTPFTAGLTEWSIDQHFPWREANMDQKRVEILFMNGFLKHDDEAAATLKVGDGLEALTIESLHEIVADYNARVKAVCVNKAEAERRSCPKSLVRNKQIGLIRTWRINQLNWLDKAEAVAAKE